MATTMEELRLNAEAWAKQFQQGCPPGVGFILVLGDLSNGASTWASNITSREKVLAIMAEMAQTRHDRPLIYVPGGLN